MTDEEVNQTMSRNSPRPNRKTEQDETWHCSSLTGEADDDLPVRRQERTTHDSFSSWLASFLLASQTLPHAVNAAWWITEMNRIASLEYLALIFPRYRQR
jgi:hypothetical protein